MSKTRDPEFWKQVRTNPIYRPMIDRLKEYYDYSYMAEIPALSYSSRTRYYRDGDRNEF